MTKVIGAMSALITPFKNDKVDFVSYEKIIKRQIAYKMDACVPIGTTGESTTLSHDEHKECIEVAVSICKGSGVQVLAGAGSNSTKEAIADLKIYFNEKIDDVKANFAEHLGIVEKKQDKHNSTIERTYCNERDISIIKEQIKVANHRIEDLEHK